jgi:hypothetical protein
MTRLILQNKCNAVLYRHQSTRQAVATVNRGAGAPLRRTLAPLQPRKCGIQRNGRHRLLGTLASNREDLSSVSDLLKKYGSSGSDAGLPAKQGEGGQPVLLHSQFAMLIINSIINP